MRGTDLSSIIVVGDLLYINGDRFSGLWSDDKACGVGVLEYQSGDVYEGGWENDLRHGEYTQLNTSRFISSHLILNQLFRICLFVRNFTLGRIRQIYVCSQRTDCGIRRFLARGRQARNG